VRRERGPHAKTLKREGKAKAIFDRIKNQFLARFSISLILLILSKCFSCLSFASLREILFSATLGIVER